MKKRILLFTVIAGMISLTMSSYLTGPATYGYDCTGAESASTGAFANPTGCAATGGSCHSTYATTTVAVNIALDSVGVAVTHYIGGHTYTVKISGNNGTGTTFPYFGFELTSIKGSASAATVSNAGTWAAAGLPARTQITPPGTNTQLNIVEHNDTIEVINDTFSRSFTWTAPAPGTGTISFWGAVNFVNGGYLTTGPPPITSGDLWNTNRVVITEDIDTNVVSHVAVANVTNNISINAFPNPVSDNLNLQINNGPAGNYSIQVFDLEGRCVSTDNIQLTGTSQVTNINAGSWAPGLYVVVVQNDNNSQIVRVVKNL